MKFPFSNLFVSRQYLQMNRQNRIMNFLKRFCVIKSEAFISNSCFYGFNLALQTIP
jgi:hypothetical protein